MNIASTIAKMRAAGMTAEAILLALECMTFEAQQNERSGAARRQAAYRERVKAREAEHNEGHNALRNVDNSVTNKKGFDKESFQTFKEITSKKTTTSRARLPDDWEPCAKTWRISEDLGFSPREVFDQIERMRDWAINAPASKALKSNWDSAFRNWLKRAADDKKQGKSGSVPKPNTFADGFDKIDAALGELERRERQRGEDGSILDIEAVPGLRQSAA